MSLYYPSPCPHNKDSKFQLQLLSLCRLHQLAMPSRLTVVLVSLLLAAPAVTFWLWLMILPARVAIQCPEECRCETEGYYVNCSNSGLNSIPSIVPTDVRILVIDGNSITNFEKDCFVSKGLVELQILKADFCKLRKTEFGAFNGLSILIYLSLESNEISEIIPGTFEMSSLEYLKLGNNFIEHLEGDVFSGLVNLKYIYLGGNKLQYLHPNTFIGLLNLQRLFMSKTSGLQIPTDRHFINSHSLKHLDISDCNISSVSVETFANISALELLDLSYNNLRSIDINVLKTLPKLSAIYLHGNPLQCDCQLQEVWRWCQDQNIHTAYKEIAPECDTPREVKWIWWGVLEKVQCLPDNMHYYEDYNNTRFSYTLTDTETDQRQEMYLVNRTYELPVVVVFFIFGTTANVILIIIITSNKDMKTVPNMYILNLAISDMIILTLLIYAACANRIPILWLSNEVMCFFLPFCYQMVVGLTTYSIAVLSFVRYRVTMNPLHVRVSSQPTWRATLATISGVWIVAALLAIPAARSRYLCDGPILLWRRNYYQHVTLFHLLVSCVLPLCVIAFSYSRMARHLVESSCSLSEEKPNPLLNTRKNTARVLSGLTVVFLITYFPIHIWATCFYYFSIHLDIYTSTSGDKFGWVFNETHIGVILHLLLSISSCLNPVALFCTSPVFRREFKRYLTCSCKTKSPLTDFELSRRN